MILCQSANRNTEPRKDRPFLSQNRTPYMGRQPWHLSNSLVCSGKQSYRWSLKNSPLIAFHLDLLLLLVEWLVRCRLSGPTSTGSQCHVNWFGWLTWLPVHGQLKMGKQFVIVPTRKIVDFNCFRWAVESHNLALKKSHQRVMVERRDRLSEEVEGHVVVLLLPVEW